MRIAPYIIFGSGSVLYLWRGAGKMATINSTETGRAAAAKNYTARNSFYNILINVRDNSMLSCPRIKRHTGARQFEAHRALELTLRSLGAVDRAHVSFLEQKTGFSIQLYPGTIFVSEFSSAYSSEASSGPEV